MLLMTEAAKLNDGQLLEQVASGRNGRLPHRLAMLYRTGLHRKGVMGHSALWLAAALRRM